MAKAKSQADLYPIQDVPVKPRRTNESAKIRATLDALKPGQSFVVTTDKRDRVASAIKKLKKLRKNRIFWYRTEEDSVVVGRVS